MNKLIKFTLIFILFLTACSKKKIDNYQEVYEVEIIGTWSNSTHPTDFPENAGFSAMVGLSHVDGLDVIGEGLLATPGIQEMAETGNTDLLDKEFLKLHNQTFSLDNITGESFSTPGSNKSEIGVEGGRHNVTFFSKIGPSPDWFVAVTTSLIDPTDGNWYDKVIVQASSYDAGTDNGTSFNAENIETNPREGVHKITTGPLIIGTDTVKNMATFIFTRVKK